ncbi:MAG: TetR family transcriptional regulator, partial [Acidobacteriia bacterium]|nr:TetR family transcriptional regulator [Methyloceanibacter sp.]MCL6491649.1 TetR family transcriptional regulator [Terriglobia bacterium]
MTAFAHLSSSELDKLTEAALTPRLGAEDQALLNMLLQDKQPIALNPLKLPARPRTGFSRHAKRRAEVRQAALALFAERGVAQTSLTRIASKLERSAGALRMLYPDKAALLAEILQAHLAALLEAVDAAAAPKESAPRKRLEAMAAACLKLLAGEGAAVQRIFASA